MPNKENSDTRVYTRTLCLNIKKFQTKNIKDFTPPERNINFCKRLTPLYTGLQCNFCYKPNGATKVYNACFKSMGSGEAVFSQRETESPRKSQTR